MLQGHSSVLTPDGSILILGGRHDDTCSAQMLRFDPSQNTIIDLKSPLNQPRSNFHAIMTRDLRYIYVVGGLSDNGQALASIEKYDNFAQRWDLVSPMNSKRVKFAACQIIR